MNNLYDEVAEEATLGSLIIDPTAIPEVAAILAPSDFYLIQHQAIYEALLALGAGADMLTIADWLNRQSSGGHEKCGGDAYLARLMTLVPTALNAKGYAEIVVDRSLRRRILAAATSVASITHDMTRDADELLSASVDALTRATSGAVHVQRRGMNELAATALEKLEERIKAGGALLGVSSGIKSVDGITMGFQPGKVYVVAARPGQGKSTLMGQISLHAALSGQPVLFCSLEMSGEEITSRLAKAAGRVGYTEGMEHLLDAGAIGRLVDGYSIVSELGDKLEIISEARISRILAECELAKRRGAKVIIIDYLQIAVADVGTRNTSTRSAEIEAAMRAIKLAAMRLGLAIIVGSQLNREASSGRPTLAHLREGGIENDADCIIALWLADEGQPNAITASVIKNRGGRVGETVLFFHKDQSRFSPAEVVHL